MRYQLLFLSVLLLFASCDDSEAPFPGAASGPLKKVEGFIKGMPSDEITELTYDGSGRVESIQITQGNFAYRTYEVAYSGEAVTTLTITRDFINSGTMVSEVFDVDDQGGQIILSSPDAQGRYVLTAADGYINTFEDHYDRDNGYFNAAHFVRSTSNNIDTISHFTTNATDSNLLAWQYTFSDFAATPSLNAAFNPAFNYAFGFYDPYIGLALGLKVSEEAPLTSSYLDGNGTYRAVNVSADMEEVSNGLLMKLGYSIADLPDNTYHLEFEYYEE